MSMKEANLFGEGLNADLYAALDVTDKEIHILKGKLVLYYKRKEIKF